MEKPIQWSSIPSFQTKVRESVTMAMILFRTAEMKTSGHGRGRKPKLSPTNLNRQGRISGFTLLELLISLAIGMIVLGAIYTVFTMQNKHFTSQEQIAEMQQIARTTMDVMIREISMAGYDPNKWLPTPIPANAGITSAAATSLAFTADLNENGVTTDANENVTYAFDSANYRITRNTGGGAQPFAENIEDLAFTYYKADGITAATLPADILMIKMSIRVRTAKPDPTYAANGGYRTFTLTSNVTLRNKS